MNLIQYRPRAMRGVCSNNAPALVSEWDRMMDELFHGSLPGAAGIDGESWAPRADIREEKDRYVADFELPGLEKSEVQVTLENNVLTVAGERKREETREEDRIYRCERYYGKFARSLRLPDDVDAERVEAGFKNGVLRIAVAKKEEAKARAIEIK